MSYKTQDGLSEEDIKRIINNEVLEKWLKDKVKEVYKEEKEENKKDNNIAKKRFIRKKRKGK